MILQVSLALIHAREKVPVLDLVVRSVDNSLYIVSKTSKLIFLICYIFVIIQPTFLQMRIVAGVLSFSCVEKRKQRRSRKT